MVNTSRTLVVGVSVAVAAGAGLYASTVDADQADLAPGDLVIGFEHDGDARAYPQQIVVYHEIVNDRETDSFCSQIAATCYRGDHTGETLVEHDAVWTTWERWRSVHPDTRVLTDDTGHVYAAGDDQPEVSDAGDGAYQLDGQSYGAADLPLDRQVSLDAFFFAWNAFYPESETPS